MTEDEDIRTALVGARALVDQLQALVRRQAREIDLLDPAKVEARVQAAERRAQRARLRVEELKITIKNLKNQHAQRDYNLKQREARQAHLERKLRVYRNAFALLGVRPPRVQRKKQA